MQIEKSEEITFWGPLSAEEITILKKGEVIEKYIDIGGIEYRITIGNKKPHEARGIQLLLRGIQFGNEIDIALDDKKIKTILDGDGIIFKYKEFKIIFLTDETWKKLGKEKNVSM